MSRRFFLVFFVPAVCAAMLFAARAANSTAEGSAVISSPAVAQSPGAPSIAQGPADLILTNAQIETMDPVHEWAGAVAIRGESIVAVSYITPDSADCTKGHNRGRSGDSSVARPEHSHH